MTWHRGDTAHLDFWVSGYCVIGLKTSTLERFSPDQKLRNEIEIFKLSEGKKTDEKHLCDDDEYQNQTHPSSDSTSHWLMARAFFRRPIRLQSKRKTIAKPKQSCVYFRQSFENGSIVVKNKLTMVFRGVKSYLAGFTSSHSQNTLLTHNVLTMWWRKSC